MWKLQQPPDTLHTPRTSPQDTSQMTGSVKPSPTLGMNLLSLLQSFQHYLFHVRNPKTQSQGQGKEVITTHSTILSSNKPPQGSTIPSDIIWHGHNTYYNLAQRLQQSLPPTCKWLGPGDIQIIGMTPISSGGYSEVWQGSLQGLLIAVKSFRCYSCPELDPKEVGVVSTHQYV